MRLGALVLAASGRPSPAPRDCQSGASAIVSAVFRSEQRVGPRPPRAAPAESVTTEMRTTTTRGRLAARVFRMFAGHLTLAQTVVTTKQPPNVIRDLYRECRPVSTTASGTAATRPSADAKWAFGSARALQRIRVRVQHARCPQVIHRRRRLTTGFLLPVLPYRRGHILQHGRDDGMAHASARDATKRGTRFSVDNSADPQDRPQEGDCPLGEPPRR